MQNHLCTNYRLVISLMTKVDLREAALRRHILHKGDLGLARRLACRISNKRMRLAPENEPGGRGAGQRECSSIEPTFERLRYFQQAIETAFPEARRSIPRPSRWSRQERILGTSGPSRRGDRLRTA